MSCCKASRSPGGVILLDGVALETHAVPKLPGITVLPHTPQSLAKATALARQGAQVALMTPVDHRQQYTNFLRKAHVPFVTALLYRSPAQLVAGTTELQHQITALATFYARMTGTRDSKTRNVGLLRHADLDRVAAKLRAAAPLGSAAAEQCDAIARDLRTALGLGTQRMVYVVPRRSYDLLLPVASASQLQMHATPYFARPLSAGSALAITEAPEESDATEPPTAASTAAQCSEYYVVQNGVNAATVLASRLSADTLGALRTALKSDAPANGMMFLRPNQFPVAEQKAAAAAAAAAQSNAAAAQQSAEDTKAKLAPAVTAGPLPDATLTTGVASAAGAVSQAVDLTMDQWAKLFQANNLLRGYSLTADGPKAAPKTPWTWTPDVVSYTVQDASTVKSTLCKTVASAESVASGYTSASVGISAGIPAGASVGVNAGVSRGSAESDASSENETTLITQWLYPRTKVWPTASLKLSDTYLSELRAALDPEKEPSAVTRSANLNKVLLQYGDFYPESVLLGGKAYQMEASSGSGAWSGDSTTKSTSVGLSAGYGAAGVNAGVSTGGDTSDNSSSTAANANNSYQTVGGNGLLTGNSDLWIQSVGDVANWRVIEFGRFTEMTDFLPADITDAMTDLSDSTPETHVVNDSATLDYTKGLDKKYLQFKLKSDSSGLALGVLSQAQVNDTAVLRAAPTAEGFVNSTIWYAEYKSSGGVTLKAMGSPTSALYLTQHKNETIVLEALKYGDSVTDQVWVVADVNGAKALISTRNYKAVGKGKGTAVIHADAQANNLSDAVFSKTDYHGSGDYNNFNRAGDSLGNTAVAKVSSLSDAEWQYLFDSWSQSGTDLQMYCRETQGEDNTYRKTYSVDFRDMQGGQGGQFRLRVGKSDSNTKSVSIDAGATCPAQTKGDPKYSDTFAVNVIGTTAKVTRLDAGGGWGQDLSITCTMGNMSLNQHRDAFNTQLRSRISAYAGQFRRYVDDKEGKIDIQEIKYTLKFPDISSMVPHNSKAASARLQSSSQYAATGFVVNEIPVAGVSETVNMSESYVGCGCCRQGFASASVGSSSTNTKTVSLAKTPKLAYGTAYVVNDPSMGNIPDAFKVGAIDNKARTVAVTRTDSGGGWGQSPTLMLCPTPDWLAES
eukprot:CAMPEP_0174312060 /NCGR_PEP_ID=MMETSP0810-20121108/4066_1 /TAXON_ID=73025 ORGANISM="Eutreptiella gymnastica-like, Strain CCMP1594" /NCGR_SAMPLE_ID=MMETSP0810 /ASSEMBLY_ACC=CAM_ASM_000659 /LENGTH=1133 /DNA_ID=CAMNT_0015420383 /DNA_START=37 /DNA_END=3439 /DNA_ORIENTATION=+